MLKASLPILAGMSFLLLSFQTDEEKDSYVGYAYEKGNAQPVYSEEFTDKFVNGNHVETIRMQNPVLIEVQSRGKRHVGALCGHTIGRRVGHQDAGIGREKPPHAVNTI